MQESHISPTEHSSPQNVSQRWFLFRGWLPCMVFALAGSLWLLRMFIGDATPPLSPEALEAAEKLWESQHIENYRVTVQVQADRLSTYSVEVKQGRPTQVLLNNTALTDARIFDTWTLPGMFNTIAEDLTHVNAQQSGKAEANVPRLRLWCLFDQQNGLPLKYRRLDWQKGIDVTWSITKFEIVSKENR
jgi:Family of unknown function (DUF6174)